MAGTAYTANQMLAQFTKMVSNSLFIIAAFLPDVLMNYLLHSLNKLWRKCAEVIVLVVVTTSFLAQSSTTAF